MKKIIATLAAMSLAFVVLAQEEILKEIDAVKVSESDVPGPVVKEIEDDFPNMSPFQYYNIGETSVSSDWKISEEVNFDQGDKIDHYVVEMKGENANYHALYDSEGKLLMSREMQKDVALPHPIVESIAKKYPGVGIKKDEHSKVIDHDKKEEYYVVTLANGKKITFLPDGTVVKEK